MTSKIQLSIRLNLSLGFLFFILSSTIAQTPCPLNFDDDSLKVAKTSVTEWNGRIIALDAEVIQIEKGYRKNPDYKIKLKNGGQLWVGSLITSGYEKVGIKLRLLGYFATLENDDQSITYNKDGFQVLVFAVINLATRKLSMLPGTDLQVSEWKNGKVPIGEK